MKKIFYILLLSILSLNLFAKSQNIQIDTMGENIYLENCAICHSIKGEHLFGPDFNIVSYTRTNDEIKNYIVSPGTNFRKFGYSANAMPTLNLTPEEVDSVVYFIDKLQPFKNYNKH